MRSKRALINTIFSVLNQIILAIVNIIIRKVMISSIGVEYLGINGLFSNILSLLSLTESGFGVAIVYKLYKPIAQNNKKKIGELLNFYSRIYRIIAVIITIAGIVIMPILPYVIGDTSLPMHEIYIYYVLFLINNVAGYFIAYKTAFLTACQQNFYVMIINSIVTVIMSGLRIIALFVFNSFVLYLVVIIITTILINAITAIWANMKYPYLKNIKNYTLSTREKKAIYKDCKALIFHKIGAYVLTGTDNILISMFVNVVAVGLYSNYLIVINLLNNVLTKLFDAIVPAEGNILASEGEKSAYNSFKMVMFFCFLLQTFCSGMLLCLLQPFIAVLFGNDCLLDMFTVALIVFNFYFLGMRRPATTMKNAGGVFFQDRYFALAEAVANLIISIIGVKSIGLPGIFIGTILSGLMFPNIVGPFYLYRDVFKVRFWNYLLKIVEYYVLTAISVLPIYYFIQAVNFDISIFGFTLRFMCSVLLIGGVCVFMAFVLPERKFTLKYARIVLNNVRKHGVK